MNTHTQYTNQLNISEYTGSLNDISPIIDVNIIENNTNPNIEIAPTESDDMEQLQEQNQEQNQEQLPSNQIQIQEQNWLHNRFPPMSPIPIIPNQILRPTFIRQPYLYDAEDEAVEADEVAEPANDIDQLPPMPAALTRQSSVYNPEFENYIYSEQFSNGQSHLQTQMSKIELIKHPLETFLSAAKNVAPLSRVTLITYDDNSNVYNGTLDEIINIIRNIQTGGSTNFITMIKKVKEILTNIDESNASVISQDEHYTPYLFVLTDGYHNHGGPIEQLLSDQSICGLFNLTLGIGSNADVQSNLLKHLSGTNDDAHHVTSNAIEIEDLINGGCFEGVISLGMRNVGFEAIFEVDQEADDAATNTNTDICVLGEDSRELMTASELESYLSKLNVDDLGQAVLNEIATCKEVYDYHYVLVPISRLEQDIPNTANTTTPNKFHNTRIHFIIALDRSGSMGDRVRLNQFLNSNTNTNTNSTTNTTTNNLSNISTNGIYRQNATIFQNVAVAVQPVVSDVVTQPIVSDVVTQPVVSDDVSDVSAELAETSISIEKPIKRRKIKHYLKSIDETENVDFTNSVESTKTDPTYFKISFKKMSAFTQASAMIFKGKLSHLVVHYQDQFKVQKSEIVNINRMSSNTKDSEFMDTSDDYNHKPDLKPKPIAVFNSAMDQNLEKAEIGTASSASNEARMIIQYVKLIQGLDEIRNIPKLRSNFRQIKEKIQTLHNDNIGFLVDIDQKDLEPWLIQQCKSLWEQIESRYRSTLSRGEQFVEFAEITPSALCRGVSATISCRSSTQPVTPSSSVTPSHSQSARQVSDSYGLCKICYCNPVNMVFTDCKHAGTCTDCVRSHIDINNHTMNCYNCPFCKTKVTSYIQLDTMTPLCECGKLVSYYGACRHPLGCRGCMKKMKNMATTYAATTDAATTYETFKCHHCSAAAKILATEMVAANILATELAATELAKTELATDTVNVRTNTDVYVKAMKIHYA